MKKVTLTLTLVLSFLLSLTPVAPAQTSSSEVTVRRTLGGVVHVTAGDFRGLGFGYGYVFAEDNLCAGAEIFLTVAGERSRYFNPNAPYENGANSLKTTNLRSDFFYARINDSKIVEKLVAQAPPLGPTEDVRDLVSGYASGWNRYLDDALASGTVDDACAGEPWLRHIDEIDVYRRIYSATTMAGAGASLDRIVQAAPPGGPPPDGASDSASSLLDSRSLRPGMGSNAIALGREATSDGTGMLLANPHFPWSPFEDRFHQAHLTIPGEIDVSGIALFATPAILIGYNSNVAWTHTVDFVWHFNFFELTLLPGQPTTYLIDGEPEEMDQRDVTVRVVEDGVEREESHTFYETRYGPVFEDFTKVGALPCSGAGPLSPQCEKLSGTTTQRPLEWSGQRVFALGDPNANNMRALNQLLDTARAQDVHELRRVQDRYQAMPFFNTIAADSSGNAYYADHAVIPHVTDDAMARCMNSPTAIGVFNLAKEIITLDGSRSDCAWGSDPDAVVDGIFGPSRLPLLIRRDYVRNSNDNHWLANAEEPLVGYPQIFGGEQRQPGIRARISLRMIYDRLSGSDDRDGTRFTLEQLTDMALENRVYAGELVREQVLEMCAARANNIDEPWEPEDPVDVSEACSILDRWDLKADRESRGQILFSNFWNGVRNAKRAVAHGRSGTYAGAWVVPFNPADPINTPHTLNTKHPEVQAALDTAVKGLRDSNQEGGPVPLDAAVGERGWATKNGKKIPMHGGRGADGIFNVMVFSKGEAVNGATFLMAASLKNDCPEVRSLLAYSQSTYDASPYFGDQTVMFSNKDWIDLPFCEPDVAAQTLSSMTFDDDGDEDDGDQDEGLREDEGRDEDDDEDDGDDADDGDDEDDEDDETDASEETTTASTMTGGRGSLVRTPI